MAELPEQLVENFFRHESANLVAVLTRAFGMRHIDLIEDTVQSAMLEAMQVWKQRGVPDNQAGWIHRVAKNRILDALRREKIHAHVVESNAREVDHQASSIDQWLDEQRISDSLLRMMFVCCHPTLDRKTQLALTLKTLCGFSVAEIARGLLFTEATVKKRIQRAKKSLADANVALDLPDDEQLAQRLEVVHDVLYLMFNEGYSTSGSVEPIRDDICEEAARLCHLLCNSDHCSPSTKALLALLLFHSSRLETRVDGEGGVVLLEDQDRSKWDQRLIRAAQCWLVQSKTDAPGTFHLEAAIAMQHCIAPSVQETDWDAIARLYSRLLQIHQSPIYVLNRAIAIGQTGETETAMEQLQQLKSRKEMLDYLLLDCAIARIHELDGDRESAINAYLDALGKKPAPHEKSLLERKLRALSG